MKKADVEIGGKYVVKFGRQFRIVQIMRESPYGGWDAISLQTKRAIRIKSAQRLRSPAGGKYIIACEGRYLDSTSTWVSDKSQAQKFASTRMASRFFAQMARYDIAVAKGAAIEEVAA